MASWQSVVKHPLGFAGYALALVFGLLAKFGPTDRYPWLLPVAIGMACVALVGGIFLAARQAPSGKPKSAKASDSDSPSTIEQKTAGDQSPAVVGGKGAVNINYGNSAAIEKKKR